MVLASLWRNPHTSETSEFRLPTCLQNGTRRSPGSCSPVREPQRLSSCRTQRCSFTAPTSLSLPFADPQTGPSPPCLCRVSPPISVHAPRSRQAVSLAPWRSFCPSAGQLPGCSQWSDLPWLCSRDQGNPAPLLLRRPNSPCSWNPFSLLSVCRRALARSDHEVRV